MLLLRHRRPRQQFRPRERPLHPRGHGLRERRRVRERQPRLRVGSGGPAAAAVTQPSLCLIADRDRMTPAKFGHKMAATIPGAETKIFGRAGHFLPAEFPLEVNDALSAFLAR